MWLNFHVSVFVLILCYNCVSADNNVTVAADNDTLVLIHVLFRHGNRTKDKIETYPNDPHGKDKYFPIGFGQLTVTGKRKEYSIGEALRQRYDQFLGDNYYPGIIEATSTDYDRTKMSLQLVLAGLFPPKGEAVWGRLDWQPVPFNYNPKRSDKILRGYECPNFIKKFQADKLTPRMQEIFKVHKDTFDYISNHTGLNVTSFEEVYNLYFGISTDEEWGHKLPEWTNSVWPQEITKLAIENYYSMMASTELIRMAAGYFLQKIILDTQQKINGQNEDVKMYLYSGHEHNIAQLLITLGLFDEPHIPTYGSYLAFEVHNINNIYGFKVFYQNYTPDKLRLMKIAGCDSFCPMDQFIKIFEEYMPPENLCYAE